MGMTLISVYIYIYVCVCVCVCVCFTETSSLVPGPVICPDMELRFSTTEESQLFTRCPLLIVHSRRNIKNTIFYNDQQMHN